MNDFSLDKQYDTNAKFPAKAELLPEGDYAGEVTKAGIKQIETRNGPATLYEVVVKVGDTSHTITYWLTSEVNLRRCLSALKRLGFSTEEWGPAFDRPYTAELQQAGEKMVGGMLSFKRGTSNNGYPTISLEALDEGGEYSPPLAQAKALAAQGTMDVKVTDEIPF